MNNTGKLDKRVDGLIVKTQLAAHAVRGMASTGRRRRAECKESFMFAFTVKSTCAHLCHTLHVRVEETIIVIMSV